MNCSRRCKKNIWATANTSSGGFGSSNAPKPVDMGMENIKEKSIFGNC